MRSILIICIIFNFISCITHLSDTTWVNELNSKLFIKKAYNGVFDGLYRSCVGNASGDYKAVGTYTDETIAWVVSWKNNQISSQSSTSWSGYFKGSNTTIVTTWVLTKKTYQKGGWDSTLINKNYFSKLN